MLEDDLVVYAGHCGAAISRVFAGDEVVVEFDPDGRVITDATSTSRSFEVMECRAHPDSTLASGTDVGFCLLAEPMDPSTVILPLYGCERAVLEPGLVTTLVGFGYDEQGNAPGAKRAVQAELISASREIRIGDDSHGPCSGDSGGPAMVAVESANDESPFEWRTVGVLSSGISGSPCGTGYYTDLGAVLDWLEQESRRDLTPCFDGNAWAPSARCTSFQRSAEGVLSAGAASFAATCGPPYAPMPDDDPPEVSILAIDVDRTSDPPVIGVRVQASDRGSGVARVVLETLSGEGDALDVRASELAPFDVQAPLSAAARRLRVTAIDHATLSAMDEAELTELSPRATTRAASCSCAAPFASSPLPSVGFLLLLGQALRRARARGKMVSRRAA